MDSSLRDRLSAVIRARPALPAAQRDTERDSPRPPAGTPADRGPRGKIPGLEKILPGRELRTRSGTCWLHERPVSAWVGADPGLEESLAGHLAAPAPDDLARDPAYLALCRSGLNGGFFLDLETTGLAGTPVFLAGVLGRGGPPVESGSPPGEPGQANRNCGLNFRLYLARDYREEAALLEAVAAEFEARATVITYNGKSYDIPFLKERAARLRIPLHVSGGNYDLLHPARRRWASTLPDCRLTTLEWHLCGRKRSGDIPGSQIPALYHRWVQERDPRPLLPVFRHNMVDLYTLAELIGHVSKGQIRGKKSDGDAPHAGA